jgi:ribosomal protein S18 acetylase RimI-like enzyme
MGIELRPMRAGEFSGYLDYFVPDYAAEISSNYGLPDDEALARASREISEDLAQGVDTPGHALLCITDRADVIGYLWYKPDLQARSVFIYDFCILPAHRGKGFGKQALSVFEAMLVSEGFEQIGLRVAADNEPAQNLYLKGGFRATGINMIRRIGQD